MKLKSTSPQGSKPINREAILRALLAAPLEGISTFTALHHRLDTDVRFRYQCGFRLDERAPSIATLSRVFTVVTKKVLPRRSSLIWSINVENKGLSMVDGRYLAIDSTAIKSYEKKQPKRHSQKRATPTGVPNEIALATSLPGLATRFISQWTLPVSYQYPLRSHPHMSTTEKWLSH